MSASGKEWQGDPDIGSKDGIADFSLIRDDASYRLQRRLGLIPPSGMGIKRRAIIFAGITWVPMLIWAALTNRLWSISGEDAFLSQFDVHIRCLVSIPMLVIAEGVVQQYAPHVLRQFVESGLVHTADLPKFRDLILGIVRLKNRLLPWFVILGIVVATMSVNVAWQPYAEYRSAATTANARNELTFGAWWFLLVIRPLFTALFFAWLWRTALVFILMFRLTTLPMALVPIHPDRMAGLGFIQHLAIIFSPVAFAISAALAGSFAYEIVFHGVNIMDIKFELIASAVLISALFLMPFLPLSLLLTRLKRKALREYGRLVTRHGRLVHRRWILGEDIGAPDILDAPELGPVADVQTMYQSVREMRSLPFSKHGLALIIVPATLPLLLITLLQLPIQSILEKVLKTLV